MIRFLSGITSGAVAAVLVACGASDRANDEDPTSDRTSETVQAPPDLDQKQAKLERFRDADPSHCLFYKETEGTDDGEFAGAKLTVCSGRLSRRENYAIALVTESGNDIQAGTVNIDLRHNPDQNSYSELFDLVYDMTGIRDQYGKNQFKAKLRPLRIAAPNMYSVEFTPFLTTRGGVQILSASNLSQTGLMTLRVLPAN